MQFIFGPSGAGKSQYIYSRIIDEAMENPDINYIILVPEQYSMEIQKKIIEMHPRKGSMNIDVIGMNRLTYRVFGECNYNPGNVLEDFGKTMLLRQVAGTVKDDLKIYRNHLGKSGFIDEAKSLMSELYQYDVSREKLKEIVEQKGKTSETLYKKLQDLLLIYDAFDERIKDEYIVAEQMMDILAERIKDSGLIKNSVICMDAFTGFTPSQEKVIEGLIKNARKVYMVLTIDRVAYTKKIQGKKLPEHDIFYLTSQTIDSVSALAKKAGDKIDEDICIGFDEGRRWDSEHKDIEFLEKNIFRYPYNKYPDAPQNIFVDEYDNPRKELSQIGYRIWKLVKEENYRYKDIAVICGNLTNEISHIDQIFPMYDIPYFVDYSRPVKNNSYIDALGHILRIVKEDFSYDSIFAFIKSGVFTDISNDEAELLENYVLRRGVKGASWWNKEFDVEVEYIRKVFCELVMPFYEALSSKSITGEVYIKNIYELMERLSYSEKMQDMQEVYDKLCSVLDKISCIMGNEIIAIDDFCELMDLGLKDLDYGVVPSKLDMVVVGDITRTRLESVKVLFILNVNDGIIPNRGGGAKIIVDSEKEKLSEMGIQLAPTDKTNTCTEQFYLYLNMTKPNDRLYMSYVKKSSNNENMRPSYVLSRLTNVFPKLEVKGHKDELTGVSTASASVDTFIQLMRAAYDSAGCFSDDTYRLYRLYSELGDRETLDAIISGLTYSNVPKPLRDSAMELLKLRLMTQSVSKLEKYARCAYGYFLQYTLGLKERQVRDIDNMSIGNILHDTMERVYKYVYTSLGGEWDRLDKNKKDELVEAYVHAAFVESFGEDSLLDKRYGYLLESLVRIAGRTCDVMQKIDAEDLLRPAYFEQSFRQSVDIDGRGNMMTLAGRIDRGDIYYDRDSKTLRLRIVDYKTGEHDFSLQKLYEGLSLQLSVYMNVMLDFVRRDKHTEEIEKVVPSGMFYYHIQDPYIEVKDENKLEEERSRIFKLKGLNNDFSGYMDNVLKFADKKLKELACGVLSGDISMTPMVEGNKTACDFCAYKNACRYDEQGGNKKRYPRFGSDKKSEEEIYSEILKELGGEA